MTFSDLSLLNTDYSLDNYYLTIACTRPTLPSISITLMPCGWVGLLVRMRYTSPVVN